MKTLTTAQKQAIAKGKLYSAYLLDITLQGAGAPILHISDRTITVSGVTYQNYLADLSGLGEEIDRVNSEGRNADITLVFKNKPYMAYDLLIQIGTTYPFEGALITIKEVLINDLGVPGEPITIHVGMLDEAQEVDTLAFTYQASSLWKLKDEQFKQALITEENYPKASLADINKPGNIIYGPVEKVRCHTIKTGAETTVVGDEYGHSYIPSYTKYWEVSDVSRFPAYDTPFTIEIGNESIPVKYAIPASDETKPNEFRTYQSNQVKYYKGTKISEVLDEYVFNVAVHPVKSIDTVYVDGLRQKENTYTAYTGQAGDEHPDYPGEAVISFNERPYIEKRVTLAASNPSHAHVSGGTSANQNATALPYVDVACSIYGGNDTDYITFTNLATTYTANSATVNYTISLNSCAWWSNNVEVTIGGITVFKREEGYTTINLGGYPGPAAINVDLNLSGAERNRITVYLSASGDGVHESGLKCQINSSSRDVIYGDDIQAATQDTELTGSPIADKIYATNINADVQGWQDDGDGTYTGTPDALIERPDYLFFHFLNHYFGYAEANIDTTSFAAAGVLYAAAISGGYKFAFVINKEVKSAKKEILESLASQCRSTLVEEAGVWYLDYIPNTAPAVDKTIAASTLAGEYTKFTFSKTPRVDIENDLTAKFGENYGRTNNDESEWLGTATASDATSQGKYGIKPANYIFNAIRSQAMADHVLSFKLLQKKNPLWLLTTELFWQHYDLERGDTIDIESDLNNGMKFFLEWVGRPRKGFIEIKGKEWAG